MKKILFILVCLCLCSCNSKNKPLSNEEIISNLIKDEMFRTLYDFESYQPIETSKIDSAFTTIYQDSVIRVNGEIIATAVETVQEIQSTKLMEINATIAAWGDNYSEYARNKVNEAQEEYYKLLVQVKELAEIAVNAQNRIIEAYHNFAPQFIGWTVTHKFRCKTKGGSYDIGNYQYVFDKDFEKTLYTIDLENHKDERIKLFVDDIINTEVAKKQEKSIIQK